MKNKKYIVLAIIFAAVLSKLTLAMESNTQPPVAPTVTSGNSPVSNGIVFVPKTASQLLELCKNANIQPPQMNPQITLTALINMLPHNGCSKSVQSTLIRAIKNQTQNQLNEHHKALHTYVDKWEKQQHTQPFCIPDRTAPAPTTSIPPAGLQSGANSTNPPAPLNTQPAATQTTTEAFIPKPVDELKTLLLTGLGFKTKKSVENFLKGAQDRFINYSVTDETGSQSYDEISFEDYIKNYLLPKIENNSELKKYCEDWIKNSTQPFFSGTFSTTIESKKAIAPGIPSSPNINCKATINNSHSKEPETFKPMVEDTFRNLLMIFYNNNKRSVDRILNTKNHQIISEIVDEMLTALKKISDDEYKDDLKKLEKYLESWKHNLSQKLWVSNAPVTANPSDTTQQTTPLSVIPPTVITQPQDVPTTIATPPIVNLPQQSSTNSTTNIQPIAPTDQWSLSKRLLITSCIVITVAGAAGLVVKIIHYLNAQKTKKKRKK